MEQAQRVAEQTAAKGAIMSQQIASQEKAAAQSAAPKTGTEVIDSRFGKLTISHDNPIAFEKGMLGMSDKHRYCLMDFPVAKFARFKLLQSLDDYELSFITMPLKLSNSLIGEQDLLDAAQGLGIDAKDLTVLLVVSVHRDGDDQVRLSVNARAPIFIDAQARKAEQLVLRNNAYQVRHMISGQEVTH